MSGSTLGTDPAAEAEANFMSAVVMWTENALLALAALTEGRDHDQNPRRAPRPVPCPLLCQDGGGGRSDRIRT